MSLVYLTKLYILTYGVRVSTGLSKSLSLGSNPSGLTLSCSITVITADSKSVAL